MQEPWQNLDMYDADSHEANEVCSRSLRSTINFLLRQLYAIHFSAREAIRRKPKEFKTDGYRYMLSAAH